MKGLCVDTGNSDILEEGKEYYLYFNGPDRFYVSRFNNKNAHFGCFRKKHFVPVVEVETTTITTYEKPWPPEPVADHVPIPMLDSDKLYKAALIWTTKGYSDTELKEYYLKPNKTCAFFYHNEQLKCLKGCFPLHWFKDFIEVEVKGSTEEESVQEQEQELLPVSEWEQLQLF